MSRLGVSFFRAALLGAMATTACTQAADSSISDASDASNGGWETSSSSTDEEMSTDDATGGDGRGDGTDDGYDAGVAPGAPPWCDEEVRDPGPPSDAPMADPCFDETLGSSIPGTSPQLLEARVVEEHVVELTFTEPLADVSGVNPRALRLSLTMRKDVTAWDGGDESSVYYIVPEGAFVRLEHVCGEPTKIRAVSSAGLSDACACSEGSCAMPDSNACHSECNDIEAFSDRLSMNLHYSRPSGGLEQLFADRDGEELEPFGAWWIDQPRFSIAEGDFTGPLHCEDTPVAIKCLPRKERVPLNQVVQQPQPDRLILTFTEAV